MHHFSKVILTAFSAVSLPQLPVQSWTLATVMIWHTRGGLEGGANVPDKTFNHTPILSVSQLIVGVMFYNFC